MVNDALLREGSWQHTLEGVSSIRHVDTVLAIWNGTCIVTSNKRHMKV